MRAPPERARDPGGYAPGVNERESDGASTIVAVDTAVLWWTLAAIALILAAAFFIARVAKRRGQSFWLWFVASIVITPPIAFLALLFVTQRPDRAAAPSAEQPYGAWGVTTGDDSYAGDHTAELERLADLRDRGALTDEEFEAQKARVLRRSARDD